METNFIIIHAKEFREVVKSYGVKYRKEIPSKKLMLLILRVFTRQKLKR